MKFPTLMQVAALATALAAGGVLAQTRPAATDSGSVAPAVVTDTGPAPAQERSSMGAIVLENSPVRAQRENALERASTRTGVATLGRGITRSTLKAQREAELAERARAESELHRLGAGALTGN